MDGLGKLNLGFLTKKIDLIHHRKIFYDRTDTNIHFFYLPCQRVYGFKKWSNPDTFMKLSKSQGLLNLSCFDLKQNLDPNILASQKPQVSKWNLE